MASPTDDELEAMAVRLECDNWFDAAAMLRAMKGRAGPDWEGFGRDLLESWPVRDVDGSELFDAALRNGLIQEVPGGYDPEQHIDAEGICPEAGDPWYEYAFGAALEPAPDQGEWDESCDIPETPVGNVGNYYGGLAIKRENGKPMWSIENWDGHDWTPCDPDVFAALQGLIKKGPDQ